MSWKTVPGKKYRVQYRETVVGGSWQSDAGGEVEATSEPTTRQVNLEAETEHHSYRVLLVP